MEEVLAAQSIPNIEGREYPLSWEEGDPLRSNVGKRQCFLTSSYKETYPPSTIALYNSDLEAPYCIRVASLVYVDAHSLSEYRLWMVAATYYARYAGMPVRRRTVP